jgi:hypothetical protein
MGSRDDTQTRLATGKQSRTHPERKPRRRTMDIYPSTRRDSRGITSGMKTAVFVVVLGTMAAVADHAFFVAPHAALPEAGGKARAVAAAPMAIPDDPLPPSLHPNQADADAPQAPTF